MNLYLYYKESRKIHSVIEHIQEIKDDSFIGQDASICGVDLGVLGYTVTDDSQAAELKEGDVLPDGLTDHSDDYAVTTLEEQLKLQDELLGNLIMEIAMLKGADA